MCKGIVALFVMAAMAVWLSVCMAQSAFGPNESSILDRLVNGYVSPATAKIAIEKLLAQCRKDVRLHPKDPVAHHNLGRALNMEAIYYYQVDNDEKGDSDGNAAIAEQQKAIKLKPRYSLAYASLGSLHLDLQDDTEAFAAFHKAVSLDPHCAGDVQSGYFRDVGEVSLRRIRTVLKAAP